MSRRQIQDKTLDRDSVTKINNRMQNLGMRVRASQGEKKRDVLDRVVKEVNPNFGVKEVEKLLTPWNELHGFEKE